MATPLRPPAKMAAEPAHTYRHWTLEEFWRFRDEVVSYANDQLIKAGVYENGGHPDLGRQLREQLEPLLEVIGRYQEAARL